MAPDLGILILKGFRLSVFTVPGRDTKECDEGTAWTTAIYLSKTRMITKHLHLSYLAPVSSVVTANGSRGECLTPGKAVGAHEVTAAELRRARRHPLQFFDLYVE